MCTTLLTFISQSITVQIIVELKTCLVLNFGVRRCEEQGNQLKLQCLHSEMRSLSLSPAKICKHWLDAETERRSFNACAIEDFLRSLSNVVAMVEALSSWVACISGLWYESEKPWFGQRRTWNNHAHNVQSIGFKNIYFVDTQRCSRFFFLETFPSFTL